MVSARFDDAEPARLRTAVVPVVRDLVGRDVLTPTVLDPAAPQEPS